ncbi:MAG: dTMP kinase [Candidatus Neomarinimicrobiota bacterium]
MSTSTKGKFITFEGIDGCGKSTQVKLLAEYLNQMGKETIQVREPGGTRVSEEIRKILLHLDKTDICDRTESLLMAGSRAQLTEEVILPNLAAGINVVADRYSDSTLAYQGGGRNLPLDWLEKVNQFATQNLEPVITFFVDVLPEEAARRAKNKKDRIEKAGIELQIKVRKMYLYLAGRDQERIVVLDGYQKEFDIRQKVINELNRRRIF